MDRTPSETDLLKGAMAFRAGRMGRRQFLGLVAAAGVLPHLVRIGDAHAAANEIVLWNWGGQAEKCHADAVGAPFTARTGMPLKFDTSGPLQGKIKEMVQSGKVTADVCDADLFDAIALGPQDILEPIDYGIVQKSRVLDGFALEYGVSVVFYGYAFMYDTQAFGSNAPQNWADFFDLAKFPGKRSLYKWGNGSIEAALMADGVPMKEVYPCDVPRALAKVKSIKADTIFWGSPSEVAQMMQNGEIAMGMIFQNRGKNLEADTKGRYKLVMNQAVAMPGAWIVPKGNPAGKKAMEFIAEAQTVDAQLKLLECNGFTPANPEAFSKIPEADVPYAITSSANIDKVLFCDSKWWAEKGGDAVNAFLDAVG
jgi:putative spermidine/putrescine transport system substrate-binding protein